MTRRSQKGVTRASSSGPRLNDLTGKEWIQLTKSWFVVHPKPRSKSEIQHPGKFPEEIAERFISFFTRKGQTVLDPMSGVGSTAVAARRLGRHSINVEINPSFCEVAHRRLSSDVLFDDTKHLIIEGDARHLETLLRDKLGEIPPIHFCFTSPPYWNMLGKLRGGSDSQHQDRQKKGLKLTYSNLEGDIGNISSYECYFEAIYEVYEQIHRVLAAGNYLVVVAQNMRDEQGIFRPIAWDTARVLSQLFMVRQEQLWLQDDKSLGIWGYPTAYVSNVHHHYCLVFQKCASEEVRSGFVSPNLRIGSKSG